MLVLSISVCTHKYLKYMKKLQFCIVNVQERNNINIHCDLDKNLKETAQIWGWNITWLWWGGGVCCGGLCLALDVDGSKRLLCKNIYIFHPPKKQFDKITILLKYQLAASIIIYLWTPECIDQHSISIVSCNAELNLYFVYSYNKCNLTFWQKGFNDDIVRHTPQSEMLNSCYKQHYCF